MKIQEKVLKEINYGVYRKSYEKRLIISAIDFTLAKVGKVIDEIECSAQDNAIWFKLKIKQKLFGGKNV